MSRLALRMIAAIVLVFAAASAQAGCKVVNGGLTVAFGPYKPVTFGSEIVSADLTSTDSIGISCNSVLAPLTCLLPLLTTSYTVKISAGGSNSVLARSMPGSNGGPRMAYNFYTNTGRTTVWGDGTTGTTVSSSITGCGTKSHALYGKVPAGQNTLKPGSFSEALTITVSFSP